MMNIDEPLMCSFQILKPADLKPKFSFSNTMTTTTSSSAVRVEDSKLASPAKACNNASPPTRLVARNEVSPPTRGDHKNVPQSIRQEREGVKREPSPPLKVITVPASVPVARKDVKQGAPSLLERNSINITPRRREKYWENASSDQTWYFTN
ncbi:hypothetical protein Sjap_021014 [Stephania japonica]|uniref:Uncharacterized protein n=1 Tax=Stephania japonica TaxID=461633 RepID=A0AAP0F4H3_9MAGN